MRLGYIAFILSSHAKILLVVLYPFPHIPDVISDEINIFKKIKNVPLIGFYIKSYLQTNDLINSATYSFFHSFNKIEFQS